MIALKLLWRDWKSGRLGLIASSLVLAVAVVAAVALVSDRVQSGLNREVSSFLAADLRLRDSREIESKYRARAESDGLSTAKIAQFSSMVFFGDSNHLASVKAVEDGYPLRGQLTLADEAFTVDSSGWKDVDYGPRPGEVWVEERLLPMLRMSIGDSLEVGEKALRVTKVLIHEPDRGSGFSVIGARVMMNHQDLDATGVVLPGSRVRYSLLLAGEQSIVNEYRQWADEESTEQLRVQTPEESEERLSETLGRGQSFLLLAGTVGLLLAAVALALSSQRYAERQKDQIALMKSWGLSTVRVRTLLAQQLSILGVTSALVGILLGWVVHMLLMWAISELLPRGLPPAGTAPLVTAVVTGFLCLIGFALPALWHLPSIAPLRVLRRDIPVSALGIKTRIGIGLSLLLFILLWYSKSFLIALVFLFGMAVVAILLGGLIYGVLLLIRKIAGPAGSIWRLAIGNLWRRRWPAALQSIAFSFTIMLLFIMIAMRTSLLEDWRAQLPEDAPNHFLVNMMSWEVEPIEVMLSDSGLEDAGWYPMVRGRLVAQNGEVLTQERMRDVDGLDREVNFTWSTSLPDTNEIVAGDWWSYAGSESMEFSMEEEVANELGVALGDLFTFNVGGREFDAALTSLRSVDWDSMRPNFYIIFPEGVLEGFSPNWITSTYLEREDKVFINRLLELHPTVLVVALDEIINRIRIVIDRVSLGLELMLLMILACGVLVLFAAIASSFDERAQESAILRTLGSSQKTILGALGLEFLFMGLIAGTVAALGAQLAVFVLQAQVFNMELVLYSWIWIAGPLSGALLIAGLGLLRSFPLVRQTPLQSLRQAG